MCRTAQLICVYMRTPEQKHTFETQIKHKYRVFAHLDAPLFDFKLSWGVIQTNITLRSDKLLHIYLNEIITRSSTHILYENPQIILTIEHWARPCDFSQNVESGLAQ